MVIDIVGKSCPSPSTRIISVDGVPGGSGEDLRCGGGDAFTSTSVSGRNDRVPRVFATGGLDARGDGRLRFFSAASWVLIVGGSAFNWLI